MGDSRAASPGAAASPRHRPPTSGAVAPRAALDTSSTDLEARAPSPAATTTATAIKRGGGFDGVAAAGGGGGGVGGGGGDRHLAPLRVQQQQQQQWPGSREGGGAAAAAASPVAAVADAVAAAARARPAAVVAVAAGAAAAATAAFTAAKLRDAGGAAGALYALYYQPPLVALAMLWLWVACVAFFESRHIRYDVCFSPADRARLPRSARLARLAAAATAAAAGSGAAFASALASGSTAAAAAHPPALYAGLVAAAAAPVSVGPAPAARRLFAATAARVATPVRPVTWSDFLLADVATSLAAPLAGGARAVCHALTAGVLAPPDEPAAALCGRAGPVALAAAAAPFAARLAQCLRVWSDTGAVPQLWNALKYATAFPALLAAGAYERAKEAAAAAAGHDAGEPAAGGAAAAAAAAVGTALALWVACQLANTAFSYFWDVERDWEIQWFSRMGRRRRGGAPGSAGQTAGAAPSAAAPSAAGWVASLAPPAPALPPARTLQSDAAYHWLMASNAVLRLAWLARTPWAPAWARAPLAPAVAGVLEAARRAQWVPVRVEVELRKLQDARPDLGQLVPPGLPGARSSGAGGGGGGASGLNTPRGLQAGEGRPLLPT